MNTNALNANDIYLICSNEMNANPKTSKYHEVVCLSK